MTAWTPQLTGLFAGVVGILVAATAAGAVLHRRHAAGADSAAVANFNARVLAWWAMAALAAAALAGGRTGLTLLFAICSFAALREFSTLTHLRRADRWAAIAAFFAVLPLQYALVWTGWYGLYAIFIPVYAFLILPGITACRGDSANFLDRVTGMQWAVMACVYCLSHVPALLYLSMPGYEGGNLLLAAFLIFVVQISDVLQYLFGKTLGRTPLAPSLSPSKTVEGAVGGILGASLVGVALWRLTPFTPVEAGLMSLVITVMGLLGGLVMSAIKRDRGVKDWGGAIPGHGGVIDRLDSVIFSAPVFFHLVRYGWSVT